MSAPKKSAAREIVSSRLLILQSKRLMLSSAQRRLDKTGLDSIKERVDRLRAETESAQHSYRVAMLAFGSPEHMDYWIVAYGRLIDIGNKLAKKLRHAVVELPATERYEASTDVEMLEDIVGRWSDSMRAAMARSVA